jgi:crossover junction endodeoxyribonuclease RusA
MTGDPLVRLYFHAPDERMSMNRRYHWAVRARLTKMWRTVGYVAARNWAVTSDDIVPAYLPPCAVKVTFHVPDARRRDPHNTAPTVKAIIDGLVDAGFWRDDTPDQVAVLDPAFVKDKNDPTGVVVECWDLNPEMAA